MAGSRDYVNNRDLLGCLKQHRARHQEWKHGDRCGAAPRIPEYVGHAIYMICTRLGRRSNFCGYSYIDEMIGDAIESCLMAVNNFDPAKSSNPFGYFSRVAWRAMIHRIDIEKTHTYAKICNYENLHVLDMVAENSEPARVGNQFTDEFVKQFEEKLARRRAKRKPKTARSKKRAASSK